MRYITYVDHLWTKSDFTSNPGSLPVTVLEYSRAEVETFAGENPHNMPASILGCGLLYVIINQYANTITAVYGGDELIELVYKEREKSMRFLNVATGEIVYRPEIEIAYKEYNIDQMEGVMEFDEWFAKEQKKTGELIEVFED